MTRLSKKTLRSIKAEANRIKKIYEAPNPEVDAIMQSLRKEREKLNEGIVQKGTHLIIRKDGISRIYWSGNMLSELTRYYPTTKNAELADYFNVSQRTINRKASELGLTKSKQFIADVAKENGYYALVKQYK